MEKTWTAGDLRALGFDLPDDVPDHASVDRSKVWFLPLEADDSDIGVIFLAPLTWEETCMKPIGEA